MILLSIMSKEQSLQVSNGTAGIWPSSWNFVSNIVTAATTENAGLWPWSQNDWQKGYLFSFLLTFSNVLLSIFLKVFVTLLLGYAFSLKKWWGKEFIWFILLSLLVLPEVALLSGQQWVVIQLNQLFKPSNNQKTSLFIYNLFIIAVPFIASIFNALMYRNAFEAIPGRIKEVAMVDGAIGAKYLFKIAIPMVAPTTLTIVILTALASWNSYLWPSLIAGSDYRVMSVWLFGVGRENEDQNGPIFNSIRMAGAILVIAPMFLFYFVFRKKIMNAISRQGSAIKG
ncbi:ABC-type maltose transport systems, permease component [Mycoplasmopsis maculosa]|uniref:ABC-type maltose transport systems, permease component n=2 Tax=Mycoplasmopsis maculosa TaxID=114885 RepID=A0A449B4H7_9BACT|nr:ABC-type maltose transport systems, permease component [Mycoplasmopsis maculosa]